MTILFSDNFESGDWLNTGGVGGAWDIIGASWSIVTNPVHSGTYAAKGTTGATGRYLQKNLTLDSNKLLILDFYASVDTATGTSGFNTLLVTDDNSGEYINPCIMFDGHFYYYDTDMHLYPIDTTYAINTWYHIQIYADVLNSKLSWVIDGNYKGMVTMKGGDTGNVLTTANCNWSYIRAYNAGTGTGNPPNGYLDDIIVSQIGARQDQALPYLASCPIAKKDAPKGIAFTLTLTAKPPEFFSGGDFAMPVRKKKFVEVTYVHGDPRRM